MREMLKRQWRWVINIMSEKERLSKPKSDKKHNVIGTAKNIYHGASKVNKAVRKATLIDIAQEDYALYTKNAVNKLFGIDDEHELQWIVILWISSYLL